MTYTLRVSDKYGFRWSLTENGLEYAAGFARAERLAKVAAMVAYHRIQTERTTPIEGFDRGFDKDGAPR